MRKTLALAGILGLLVCQNSLGEEKNQQYQLVYKMKVVRFWNVQVNWRNQHDYPTIDQKGRKLHKRITKILKNDANSHSYMVKSFTLK